MQRLEVVDPLTVRFYLKEPWPDFLTFYGTSATAAGLIVPKKYLEQVGDDGFKKHPIGLGPYKFVSFKPGIELVLEAYEGYWQKVPNVKRLIMKGVPEGTTRLAMLKKGEADRRRHARGGGRGSEAGLEPHPGGYAPSLDVLDRVYRAVGPQVGMA